jgi:hypothetical protein
MARSGSAVGKQYEWALRALKTVVVRLDNKTPRRDSVFVALRVTFEAFVLLFPTRHCASP